VTATAGFVREARPSDAPSLARVQVASWQATLGGLVPAEVLAELSTEAAISQFEEQWHASVASPPTTRHRVLVAYLSPGPQSPLSSGPGSGSEAAPAAGPASGSGSGAGSDSGTGSGAGSDSGAGSGSVVGFASIGPATDEDRWPGSDGEMYEFHLLPSHADGGHGGRLLHAVADTLSSDSFTTACAWVLAADHGRLEFLKAAGWALDGSQGNLDMGVKVPVVRLHTLLAEPTAP